MPNIYDYDDFKAFLKEAGPQSFERNPAAFSLSLWAKKLGYSSHRAIAMVLTGERLPSLDMVDRISKYLGLSSNEKKYFELLILRAKHSDRPAQLDGIEKNIAIFRKRSKRVLINDTDWELIYRWYFFVIKQLVGTQSFRKSPVWIAETLRKKVDVLEVRRALSALMKLGLIDECAETGRLLESKKPLMTSTDVPNDTIKKHHVDMMERAKEALYEQSVDNRDYKTLTLRFDKKKIQDAKRDIFDFLSEFDEKYSSNATEHVYQVNLQFFEHTK